MVTTGNLPLPGRASQAPARLFPRRAPRPWRPPRDALLWTRMADKRLSVLDLLDLELRDHNSLNLRCIGGRKGLGREITIPDLNRPGLALSGFFDSFAHQRIQLFGRG